MAEDIYEVDQVIGKRVTTKGQEDYLVRWQNYSSLLSTWEPIDNFKNCQAAIRDFYNKNWPIPGSQAKEVIHLERKPHKVSVKQELLTLQNLPVTKGKKLLKGLRKDLKDEILRLQDKKLSRESEPLRSSDMNRKMNYESPKRLTEAKKPKGKRLSEVTGTDSEMETKKQKVTKNNSATKYFYLRSKKASHKDLNNKIVKKDFNLRKTRSLPNGVISPRKETDDISVIYNLPSRITRQSLPSCSTTCVLEEELVVKQENGCMYIKFCNESKKNVINLQMCERIIGCLQDANKDDISVVVFTGSGSCFTFGWDLDVFKKASHAEIPDILQKYKLMVRLLITCPKLLVAAVNGPAVGFGVSLAILCDVVFADNQASFETKFTEWGHPPIGCCSYTLRSLLGSAQTMSLLLLNNKLLAKHALQKGLVTQVLELNFDEQLETNLQKLCTIPHQCLQNTKSLLHNKDIQELADVNTEECGFFLKYISHETTLENIVSKWRETIEQ